MIIHDQFFKNLCFVKDVTNGRTCFCEGYINKSAILREASTVDYPRVI